MVVTTSLYTTYKLALMLPTYEETQQIKWGKGVGDEVLELPLEIHL